VEHWYIQAELPRLPFEDGRFDLVLSGHVLFTHSDRFDYAFHRRAILELVRVSAREVRIYPLQGPDARIYKDLDNLRSDVRHMGFHSEIYPVPFEFQRGSNQMLLVIR